ncbi:MAG: GNAT family N-acetyltransferase, partial [Defluviitaleaceae bacterium]|nr:GNAT family N-acetyltransferase [Defluviitaleaceae bacterium]
ILYQIDSQGNGSDWFYKEGYGFVRELYIEADLRNGGYGRALATHAENEMLKRNPKGLYLTADDEGAMKFWARMGYRNSGEICPENNSPIHVK